MSIIYDALKKVENSQQVTPPPRKQTPLRQRKNLPVHPILIYIFILTLGIFAANLALKNFKTPPRTTPPLISTAVAKPETAPKPQDNQAPVPPVQAPEAKQVFNLSGVFFSGNEAYAVINNKVTKKGDFVEGAEITKITLSEVQITDKDGKITTLLPDN